MDQEQMWRKRLAAGDQRLDIESGRSTGELSDRDENPPWERASARIPIPNLPPMGPPPVAPSPWQLDPVGEHSFPSTSLEDVTGTGKIAAVMPLRAGVSAWSAGIRAPQATAQPAQRTATSGVEYDEQPSVQMRALRTGNLVRATAIVTSAIFISRIFGLLRTTLFSSTFGVGFNSDAFTYAFTLPDLVFQIVAGGALASAFIPVFADYMIDKRDRKTAWYVSSAALNLTMAFLIVLAVGAIIFAPQLTNLMLHQLFIGPQCVGPGDHPKCMGPVVVSLTRIMLLQPIFLGGATIAVAILQARQSFMLPALGQVIYTASLIGGILASSVDARYHIFGGHLGIAGPAWGVAVGAALQFVIQVPGLVQAKMHYTFTFDALHPGIREMFRLMVPRLLNAVMLYASVLINRNFLTILDPTGNGAAYAYTTAFTLVMLPTGIFGVAVSQAAFPTLSAYVAAGEWQRLRETIVRTLRGIIYLAVPSSLGIIVLAYPICRLILSHGAFTQSKLPLFTGPLIAFAIGLAGLSLVEILTRSFYALRNTRTPTEVSILQFMFSIGLSLILLTPMGASGLALASAIAWIGEAVVLLLLLRPQLGGLDLRALGSFLLNVLAASVVTGLAALLVYELSQFILPIPDGASPRTNIDLGIDLILAMLAGCGAYVAASRFLGIEEVLLLNRLTRRLLRR